jgi:hypothetical protein
VQKEDFEEKEMYFEEEETLEKEDFKMAGYFEKKNDIVEKMTSCSCK